MKLPEMTMTDKLGHHWQVAAVLLMSASVWTLCWWLSSLGLLDLAATAISFFAVQLARQIGGSIASRAPKELKPTATLLDQARADFRLWMRNRQLATHAIIALIATIGFLVGRFLASTVMTMIASPWLALAVGLAVAAMIASPVLVRAVLQQFSRSRKDPDAKPGVATKEKNDEHED